MATFPERALASLNAVLAAAADALLAPMLSWSPLASLAIIALVTAIVLLPIVARTSNQPRIRATKRAIQAGLFEIRLFADDPLAVLRSFADVLTLNVRYLGLSLVPLLWLLIPLALVMPQLEAFFGYGGLSLGVPALVTVDRSDAASTLTMSAPPQIRVETEAVLLAGSNEVVWRIVPMERGAFTLSVRDGEQLIEKTIAVDTVPARKSPRRQMAGVFNQLLYPSEPPLPAGPITSVSVRYPGAGIEIFGWRVHWLIAYGTMSMMLALILAPRFGVTL